MRKALALICYNRLDYLQQVLPSIQKQTCGGRPLSDAFDLYLFQDGLRDGETSSGQDAHREVRDYIDVAAALERYSLERVLELAHAADPALDPQDMADAGRYLDRLDDARFALYGLTPAEIGKLRERLGPWPRG